MRPSQFPIAPWNPVRKASFQTANNIGIRNELLAIPEGPFFKGRMRQRHPCRVFSVSYSRNCRCHNRSQSLSIRSVPINALVLIEFDAKSWMVSNAEGSFGLCCGSDQIQTKWQD